MSRIDKFLWHARFFKSRTQAAEAVSGGRVRLNGDHCQKPAAGLKSGDVLTISVGSHVRVVKVLAFGTRRGPASEARLLYDDLTPVAPFAGSIEAAERASPNPERRPTKRERRALTSLKNRQFDS